MNCYLFVNAGSGRYNEAGLGTVVDFLQSHAFRVMTFYVSSPADSYSCCRKIYDDTDRPLIVIAGGDGTLNGVLNGLIPHTATLAILPMGTSNVMAAELGIHSLHDGLGRIVRGESMPLPVGELTLAQARYRFALMAGCGLDGAVVRDVGILGKKWLKQGAYALSAFRSTLAWDETCFDVVTSSGVITCHTAVICNGSRYAGDFLLAPSEKIFEPGFTVACVTSSRRLDYCAIAADLYRNRIEANPRIITRPSHLVEIRGTRPIQIDGDFIGYGPASVKAVPDFAHIIV